MSKPPKEKNGIADVECQQLPMLAYNAQCATHGQPLTVCANDRLRQVKQAREMEERTMKSARAWEAQANESRVELQESKEGRKA